MEEENNSEITSPAVTRSNEICIDMSSTEENIRKLYDASKMGSVQILNTLLEEDSNLIQKLPMSSTSNVESPLHVSVSHGYLDFTRVLLDHGPELASEVDALQQTPLHVAVTNGHVEIVKTLLEKNTSACLVRDHDGLIPLHHAVIKGKIEVIQELINARPQSVWMKLKSGQTILHLCAEGNHLEGMKLLTQIVVNHDKDFLNIVDDAGNAFLDLIVEPRKVEMVRYLLLIPEVKIRTNPSKKKKVGSKKKTSKKCRRKRKQLALPSTKVTSSWDEWIHILKNKPDWAKDMHGTMLLVATVIATVTFQAGMNPPGGVWQQDTPYNSSNVHINQTYPLKNLTVYPVGTAIMSYTDPTVSYTFYLGMNTLSFYLSAGVIILILSRLPLISISCSGVLNLVMILAVLTMTGGIGLELKW